MCTKLAATRDNLHIAPRIDLPRQLVVSIHNVLVDLASVPLAVCASNLAELAHVPNSRLYKRATRIEQCSQDTR
jgi:hypothetical protein